LKRLVIHAGFHKSGTTAIQMAFHQQREKLKAAGFEYPVGYGAWAQHVLGRPKSNSPLAKAIANIKKLSAKHERVLLSSEFFSEYSPSGLSELRTSLGPDVKVEAIFTMRRLEKVVGSQYQQLARIGIDASFQEFSDSLIEESKSTHESKVFWHRHEYDAIIKHWAEVFGVENIHVIFTDETNPSLIPNWFENYLQLPSGSLDSSVTDKINRSLDVDELAFIRELQRQVPPERKKIEWVPIFRNRLIQNIVSTPSNNPNSKKLQLNPKLHEVFSAKADAQFEAIRNLQVNTYGQWPLSAPVVESNEDSKSIYIETVARAIASIGPKSYIRIATNKVLLYEVLRRLAKAVSSLFPKK
jgi:hypothetical protein